VGTKCFNPSSSGGVAQKRKKKFLPKIHAI
jgi:hypothetical protein